ncbi:hypothetical protein DPMN_027158 [Dreissena polymorpha]|uniref:Uncharacterized protein n=1 Tax=Dreissena polymorpha TaxID=45954 RepID=A0A9D4LUP6_DREPO|nr:hypothetical protein DPMN_027158 [Dreissena polymorpha]
MRTATIHVPPPALQLPISPQYGRLPANQAGPPRRPESRKGFAARKMPVNCWNILTRWRPT